VNDEGASSHFAEKMPLKEPVDGSFSGQASLTGLFVNALTLHLDDLEARHGLIQPLSLRLQGA
jgi:hypothetical protein